MGKSGNVCRFTGPHSVPVTGLSVLHHYSFNLRSPRKEVLLLSPLHRCAAGAAVSQPGMPDPKSMKPALGHRVLTVWRMREEAGAGAGRGRAEGHPRWVLFPGS